MMLGIGILLIALGYVSNDNSEVGAGVGVIVAIVAMWLIVVRARAGVIY